ESAGRPDGRCPAQPSAIGRRPPGRGKSGLRRTRWWVTPTVRAFPSRGGRRTGKVQQKGYRLGRVGSGQWAVAEKGRVCLPTIHCPLFRGKGEKVGGPRPLNVRAHQQPGDRLARQTPPGARPNKGAGLVRPVTTPG